MQEPEPVDESSKVNKEEVLRIQQVVVSILYYARAADLNTLVLLSAIASEQAEATKKTIMNTKTI